MFSHSPLYFLGVSCYFSFISDLFSPSFSFFNYILLIVLLQLSHFFSVYPLLPYTPLPSWIPLSSCPWFIHVSSLASTFPIVFLISPCLFCTYQLCFLFPVPFPPSYPHPFPANNPPCDLCFCESVPILVVCLVCLWFCFLRVNC